MLFLQATTLNVAINSSNKALLTIMMSNNFVELKGSVFKKFDKNNLFQVKIIHFHQIFIQNAVPFKALLDFSGKIFLTFA
jgi:transmembrane anterior posterior transformation protein 1